MKVADITKKKEAQRISNPIVPQLLSLKCAAQYLGLTDWALRERVWAGHIPFVRFPGGRKQYFHIKDLDSFIEENKARYV
ncbi:MAG: helix-turn-helix domain-containing protein [Syntrophobacteraceae bacterium]